MKTIILILMLLFASPALAQTAAKPMTEYDRFKDRTMVHSQTSVTPVGEFASLFEKVQMTIGFFHAGESLKTRPRQ